MATVKCVYCGERTDKSTAYRVPKSNKQNNFHYYCSEEEYQMYIRMQEEILAEKEAIRIEREEQKKLKAQKLAERETLKKERELQKIEKQKQSKLRQQLVDYIVYEFLDYQQGQPFPNVVNKEISKYSSFYPFTVIREAIELGEETIRWRMSNTDSDVSDYAKIRYIMTIAEGNLKKVHDEWLRKQKNDNEDKEIDSNSIDLMNEINTTSFVKKQESNSILEFLGEDEL